MVRSSDTAQEGSHRTRLDLDLTAPRLSKLLGLQGPDLLHS